MYYIFRRISSGTPLLYFSQTGDALIESNGKAKLFVTITLSMAVNRCKYRNRECLPESNYRQLCSYLI